MKTILFEIIMWPWRIVAIFLFAIASLFFAILGYVFTFIDKEGNYTMKYAAHPWGAVNMWMFLIRVKNHGLEKLDKNKQYIFMPNHVSYLDVPIAVSKVPFNLRVIAKGFFFSLPFYGPAMLRAGNVKMYRDNPRKDIEQLKLAQQRLAEGKSLIVFPEGTRSRDGNLQPLKKALFSVPIRAGIPVVPMVIDGTYYAMPPDSIRFNPTVINIYYLDPIDSTKYTIKDRDVFAEDVFNRMLEFQKQLKA